ncbi:MAG: hypothetical protein H0T73_15020, partial [Ardenticatenales bacterium]|nr:hypothetical protein [Ardenticatenales bacterium]
MFRKPFAVGRLLFALTVLFLSLGSTAFAQEPPATLTVSLSPTTPAAQSVQAGSVAHSFVEYTLAAGAEPVEVTGLRVRAEGEFRRYRPYPAPHEHLHNVRVVDVATGEVLGTVARLKEVPNEHWQTDAAELVTFTAPLRIAPGERVTLALQADVAWSAMGGFNYRLGLYDAASVLARRDSSGEAVTVQLPREATYGASQSVRPTLQVALSPASPATQDLAAGSVKQRFSTFVLTAGDYLDVELMAVRVYAEGEFRRYRPYPAPHEHLRNVRVVDVATGEVLGTVARLKEVPNEHWQTDAAELVTFTAPLRIPAGKSVTLAFEADVAWSAMGGFNYRLGLYDAASLVAREASSDEALTVQWSGATIYGASLPVRPTLQVALSPDSPAVKELAAGSVKQRFSTFVLTAGDYLDVELMGVQVWAEGEFRREKPYPAPHEHLHNVRVVNVATGEILATVARLKEVPNEHWQTDAAEFVTFTTPLRIPAGKSVTLAFEADIAWSAMGGFRYRLGLREATSIIAREASADEALTVQWPLAHDIFGNVMTVSPSLEIVRSAATVPAQSLTGGTAAIPFSEYVLTAGGVDARLTQIRVWANAAPYASTTARPSDVLRHVQIIETSSGNVVGSASALIPVQDGLEWAYADITLTTPLQLRAGEPVTFTLKADSANTLTRNQQYRLGFRYNSDILIKEAQSDARLGLNWPMVGESFGNWITLIAPPMPELTVSPSGPTLPVLQGSSATLDATIRNGGTGEMSGITITPPPHLPWVSLDSAGLTALAPGTQATLSIIATPPADLVPGYYRDLILVSESEGSQQAIALTVHVKAPQRDIAVSVVNDQG